MVKKVIAEKIVSFIFVSIFFIKVFISAAPLILLHFDSKCVNAVIMQLEIESDSSKETSKEVKEGLVKGEWFDRMHHFNFSQPYTHLISPKHALRDMPHVQTFYPTVPTPPPSV